LREAQQQANDLFDLLETFCFFRSDLVDDAEEALLNKVNQAFEHLGLAGEVAVKGSFGAFELASEGGGGDLFPFGVSSIAASICRICSRRSPGFVAMGPSSNFVFG
jgi:hypothetical protein